MDTFKSFLKKTLNEEAKAKHALRFMEYEHDEHHHISRMVRADLIKAWTKIASKYPAIESLSQAENEKAIFNKVELETKEVKVGRFTDRHLVGPSVVVGNAYDRDIKNKVEQELIAAAMSIFEKYLPKMNTVNGKPFSVTQEDGPLGDVRLKFKTGDFTKTVFLISIDKTYKFDRVFLRDFLLQ